ALGGRRSGKELGAADRGARVSESRGRQPAELAESAGWVDAASSPNDKALQRVSPVRVLLVDDQALFREALAVRLIALTTFDDDEEVFAALRAGAVGYLLKDVSSVRLVEAVLAAARGESVL